MLHFNFFSKSTPLHSACENCRAKMASSWFYTILFVSLFLLSSSTPSTSVTNSYSDHCSSTVPESSTTNAYTRRNSIPNLYTSYFTGGDKLLGRKVLPNQTYYYVGKSLRLRVRSNYYETLAEGVYKVQASLFIRLPYQTGYDDGRGNFTYGGSYYRRRGSGSIVFSMRGFWSEITRKVCLVGSALWRVQPNKALNLDAVLKLTFPHEKPDLNSAIVSGVLESVNSENDPGYFEPITIFSFPNLSNYSYSTFVSEEQKKVSGLFSDFDVPKSRSLTLQKSQFCSVLSGSSTFLGLDYAVDCNSPDNRHCSPIGSANDGFLPRFLSLNPIQCDSDAGKLRYVAKFLNTSYDYSQSSNLNLTVIGEASWDDTKNELFAVLCRVLSHGVGDCTLRLIMRYPSVWNIRKDAEIVGHLWSNTTVENPGFFKVINFTSLNDYSNNLGIPGLKYEFTELDRVRNSCPLKKPVKKGSVYPDGNSYDMRFDMSVKNSKGKRFGWGYATPLYVGNESYGYNRLVVVDSFAPSFSPVLETSEVNKGPLNISYSIIITPFSQDNLKGFNWSTDPRHQMQITAEGVYDAESGYLCMIGFRKLSSLIKDSSYVSRDCDILVKLQFAPLNDRSGGFIKGTVSSTRAKTDLLYFEDLSISSAAYYEEVVKRSVWRMDLEITLVLISNTLLCVFVGLQIYHVKRNPETLSCISLFMLVVLSLGHMVPLVLNLEAVFVGAHTRNLSGEWIEANEVAVRVITMVAFLMLVRLLQLVWAAKTGEGSENEKRTREIKGALVLLPLYVLGGLFTLFLNWMRSRIHHEHSLWINLRSYAGLVLDCFLLPQIVLNALSGSSDKALTPPFYIGTSAIRLVPHAYNQYRVHNYPAFRVNGTYYYANPTADFYSTAWDVVIPLAVVALAVIVFLQQKRGGRCILPQRFRELELYQKVSTVNNDS